MFIYQLPTTTKKVQTWGTALKPTNVLMSTYEITKTGTLATNFNKPAGEANPYVRFGYGPLTIFNHTWGKVSGSMNADPINMIHKSQKQTKEGLNK